MLLRDVMTASIDGIPANATLMQAAEKMKLLTSAPCQSGTLRANRESNAARNATCVRARHER